MARTHKDRRRIKNRYPINGGDVWIDEQGRVRATWGGEAWTPESKRWAKKTARRARRRALRVDY